MPKSRLSARVKELLSVGSLFAGKYRIVEPLGTGSFAFVVRARHEVMGRDVALKVLKPELVESNPEVSDRFRKEVQIVARLSHPNSVTVFDFGNTPEGIYYMVFEYVKGVPLDQILEMEGAMTPQRAAHVVKQILKSLDEAHAHGIIHRDLKPSNIMLTEVHGELDFVKVLDFGVAKVLAEGEESARATAVRRSTQFVGTPVYMSPEQVLGQQIGPASDLYSLGLLTYEMLTGADPVSAKNVALVAQQHIDDAPLPFEKMNLVPQEFRDLILMATKRKPEDRFTDVRSFARALPRFPGDDLSMEFANPVKPADSGATTPESDGGSGQEEDIFSGKNYIALPEDSEAYDSGPGTQPQREEKSPPPTARPVKPAKKRRKKPKKRRLEARPSSLELDLETVRRDEVARESQRHRETSRASESYEGSEVLRRIGVIAGGLFSVLLGFVIFGTAVEGVSGLFRYLIGFSPVFFGALWVQFSPFRDTRGNLLERWILPLSANTASVVLAGFVLVTLFWPERAAHALRHEDLWYLSSLPDGGFADLLADVTHAIAGVFASFFDFAARTIPW